MTDTTTTTKKEQLRALALAFVMVTSVVAMTVAFSGSAAAAPSSQQINNDIVVRADDPGAFLNFQFDEADDSTSTTFTIDISELEAAGVQNLDNIAVAAQAGGGDAVSSVTLNDPDGDTNTETIDVATDGAGGGSPSTITVEIGTTAGTTSGTAATPTQTVAGTANALHTSGVSPGSSYTINIDDNSGNDVDLSSAINSDDINLNSLSSASATTNLDTEEDVSVNAVYDSDSENVVSTNSEATITVVQPELGNATVPITASALTTGTFDTATDAGTDGFTTQIEGQHDLIVAQGDVTDGVVTNSDALESTNEFDVTDLRLDLDTVEGEVAGEDTVLYNSQQSVEGTVYRTSADAPSQIVADDRVVDYEIEDPNTNTVTNGDTNTGKFSVSETWDASSTLADDGDTVDSDSYERLDGLQYTANIGDGGGPNSGDQGSDTFSTVLDISYEIDGTAASQADVTFDDTVQISGTVQDGAGNGISGYRTTAKLYADGGVATPQKVGTTTTGNNGDFSFTLRLNDGVQNPNIEALTGSNGANLGVHLGTHQVDRAEAIAGDAGGGGGAATPHPAVHYQTVDTQAQSDTLEVTADDNAPVDFQDTYRIKVTEDDGDDITGTDARVLIRGEFEGSGTDDIVGADLGAGTLDGTEAEEDLDSDANVETTAFQATPDGNGWINFTATPLTGSFTVNVTGEETTIDTDVQTSITISANSQNGAFTRYTEPDYAEVESVSVGSADPVNIVDEDVEDPQTDNPQDGSGNPDYTDGAGNANFQSIFSDNGPEVVEVLPHADTTGERISNGARLGFDQNFDLDGITVYRVQFELRDESNTPITPGTSTGDFEKMKITGAGVDAVIEQDGGSPASLTASGDGVLDAAYSGPTVANGDATDVDSDSDDEYVFLLQPTSVESETPTIDHEIDVVGESNVTLSLDADGLEVADFQVNGQSADEVSSQSTVDVTATVEDATKGGDPINNGRVRLSQNGTELEDFDARTQNTNNGEYSFSGVDVGDRGYDPDDDGIGEEISALDFTAYQYADADSDQALDQIEVNKAAVASLPIALDDSLQVEYDADNTSKYSGTDNGTFTLTRGVEYDQIAFELSDANGDPVNLTDGKNNNLVGLNTFDSFDGNSDGTDDLINIQTENGPVDVRLDSSASNPDNGYYVISDVENVPAANVSSSGGLSDSDSFVFGSDSLPTAAVRDGPDSDAQEYELYIETPDRSQATAPDAGDFHSADAVVESEVAGVAGNAVPNSVNDTDSDGDLIDELNNDQSDWSDLNTNTDGIDTPSANVNRVYRVNATVTDALGTPLNSSDHNDIRVDFDGSVDPISGANNAGDNARFEMVDSQDVTVQPDGDGILPFGDGNSAAAGSATTNDEVIVQNENGEFQFDIEVESAGDDGRYTPVFEVEAQADTTVAPSGKSIASQSPTVANPVVEVYDANGGTLPVAGDTGNQILAQDVANNLRVEAFAADEDDYTLGNGLGFGLNGPVSEDSVATSTTLASDVVTDGYSEGQLGFLTGTPTGTGDNIISLTFGGTTARDADGNPVNFDVLRSNRQVDIGLSQSSVDAGNDITVTLTDSSVDAAVELVNVTVVNPDGDVILEKTTDQNGEVTFTIPVDAVGGTYTIETRPAGYEPGSAEFQVGGAAPVDASIEFNDQTVEDNASSVTVASASANRDYVVEIQDGTATTLGTSQTFSSGSDQSSLSVSLSVNLTSNRTLTAVVLQASDDTELASDDAEITIGNVSSTDPVLDAIADQDNQPGVGFQDVLGAIDAFNQGTTINGQTVGFQDVLSAIDAFNEA